MQSCATLRDDTRSPETPPGELIARTAALCERAAAAVRSDRPPDALWLAEQLADACRLLARLSAAGTIAADAYERGRLDEREAHAAAGHLLPAM